MSSSNPIFSQQTGHKYTFQLQLKKLYISPSLPFQVKIIWARGQNRIESQNAIKLQPPQNQIPLQQCFCNKSTVLFNPKKLQFRKKQSRLQIILYANGSPKQGGEFVLNLCEILDPYNIKKQQQKTYRVITRQQKPRCEIEFKLTAQYCQQMIRDQQRSIGSGVGSISSKNTTTMGYGGVGTMNFDAKQYVQKKNLFLYEAPSKDNQSVTSYNSYSTNMMRYQSGNKKERQDSIHKEEYGLATTTRANNPTDMFAKTTSINMKSVSGQFDTKSRGGYNRVTQQLPGHNNFDNRTQNFDNPSNKQLQQQQAKRSKLQAQVSKLNIYMKQQSNKLTEYIQQNTRLKQQLNRLSSQQQNTKPSIQKQTQLIKQQYQQQLQILHKQNEDLHNRGFEVTNENREIKMRLQQLLGQRQQFDQQLRQLKVEKERAQTRFQALNRNMQGIISNKEMSSKQIENLKDQLEHIKSLNLNLRDSLEKQRRKIQEVQTSKNYQQSSIEQNLKKKQQKIYELQRQNSSLMTQIRDRQTEIQTKKQLLYRLEKTSNDYKDKILQSDSEKSQLLLENASLKNQNDKLKLEKSSINQLNQNMKKQFNQKSNEIKRLEANVKGLKQMQNKFYYFDKSHNEKQREIISLKQENTKVIARMNQFQDQNRKLVAENQQLRKKSVSVPNVDVNEILRESVQMQVQLKFKTDELLRLKNIQQKFNDVLYRLQMQEKNRKEIEQDMQKLQKQVKDKNKLYLIEIQKGKLTLREKSQIEKAFQEVKNELKRCQEIIFNGDRQVKEMQNHINFLQSENSQLGNKLASSENELNVLLAKLNDSSRLEAKIKQLAQKEQSASQKLIKMEDTHSSISNELQKSLNEKKSLELKCQTIMQELHSLKKQYEDEKVRSTSVISIRSNDDQLKIRQLQHEIDKKDKTISKLTKQKLQIEEQNINLHVQVMKKLSEMQK